MLRPTERFPGADVKVDKGSAVGDESNGGHATVVVGPPCDAGTMAKKTRKGGTREALLAAVLAEPMDDRPRLVYADWLIEQHEPRGEFIHVQCELAKLGREESARERELRAREREILAEHYPSWTAVLERADPPITGEFRRGFLEKLWVAPWPWEGRTVRPPTSGSGVRGARCGPPPRRRVWHPASIP